MHKTVSTILSKFDLLLYLLQGTAKYTGKGPKTFACPLCEKVLISINPKQHILTLMCCKELNVSVETRTELAQNITLNRFYVREKTLDAICSQHLSGPDETYVRCVLLYLGGLILDDNYEPISLLQYLPKTDD